MVAAAALLIVSAPILVAVTVAIRLLQGTPVSFKQERSGLEARPFQILKFRSMVTAYDRWGALLPDRDRLTPFGSFLRCTSLDELPQLVNVLRGDMSLVGPRPLLLEYVDRYTPEQAQRHAMKPGITGWAQVNGRNELSWEEKFRHDAWYVDNCTFALDLRILALTAWTILSAEGISQPGQVTVGAPSRR